MTGFDLRHRMIEEKNAKINKKNKHDKYTIYYYKKWEINV